VVLKGKGEREGAGEEVGFSQSITLPPSAVSLNQTMPGTFLRAFNAVLCSDLHKAFGLALMKHPQVHFCACKLAILNNLM